MTLTFSQAITGLSSNDIALSGVSNVIKGTLSGSNPYTLPISEFTVGGNLDVAVAKQGYTISGSQKNVTIYYTTAPTITSELLPDGTQGMAYSQTLTVIGDTPIAWSVDVENGTLPDGLTISTEGEISGTPTKVGKFDFTVKATNAKGSDKKALSILIAIPVTLNSVTANGSATQTTTQLTLTFSQEIAGLSADDITLIGIEVNKGTLSGSNPYTLTISNVTAGGTLNVDVSKSGYTVSDLPKDVTIYYLIPVTLKGVTANNYTSQRTSYLYLNFSAAVSGLSADDISLTGVPNVSKGTLSNSGATYTLPISGFTASGTLNVTVAKQGYEISGSPKTVTISAGWTAVETTIRRTILADDTILGIAWGGTAGNEKFVAVGYYGKAAYSADGVTWTAVADTTFGRDDNIYDITWGGTAGNEKFVAVGYSGKAAYSTDGVTWTAVAYTTFNYDDSTFAIVWGGIAGNQKFVAVGFKGAYWDGY